MPAAKRGAKNVIEVVFDEAIPKKSVVRFNAKSDDAEVASLYLSNEGHKKLGEPSKVKITIEPA